jgi:hypothetical protein
MAGEVVLVGGAKVSTLEDILVSAGSVILSTEGINIIFIKKQTSIFIYIKPKNAKK